MLTFAIIFTLFCQGTKKRQILNRQKHERNENGGVKIKPTAMVQEVVARGHTRSIKSNRVRGLGEERDSYLVGMTVWLDGGARR